MSRVFAFCNTEDQVMRSSSGGAFIAICETFEKLYQNKNVYYFGAAFDDNMNVKHQYCKDLDDCIKFQGSKYVKSNISGAFEQVKKMLNDGNAVLFSGVPCQIYGLKNYLKKFDVPTNNLLTIDVICHGTPSNDLWLKYKSWLENKSQSRLIDYSFRYKKEGWKAYPALAVFENGVKFVNTADTSVYSKLHMIGYSITEGCFKCPFSNENREGDFTLGDFWNCDKINPDMYDEMGVSLIIENNDSYHQILERISLNNSYKIAEINDRRYIECQHNLQKATIKPNNYDQFWEFYNQNSFDDVLSKYIGYGTRYKIIWKIKKLVRKTPLIKLYRKVKGN